MQHFPTIDKLHTDVLEEKYGKISSRVLKHNREIREALLVDPKGISRTYALTFIGSNKDKEIEKINRRIKNGGAIGKEFRKSGYSIRKNVLDVFKIKIPQWLKKEFRINQNYAKSRLSEFYAKKLGKNPIIYGIVTEVYSPDFRKPVINRTDKSQIGAITKFLEKIGFTKEEIWRRLGDENNYEDVIKRFEKAKRLSKKEISQLRNKIITEIESPR